MRKATTSSITVIAVTVMLAIQGVNLYRFDDHKRPLMKTQELSHQKNVLPEVITGTMTTKNSSFSNHEEKNEMIRIHGTNIITNVNITTDTDTDTDTNYSWWKGRFDPQNLTHCTLILERIIRKIIIICWDGLWIHPWRDFDKIMFNAKTTKVKTLHVLL